MKKRMNGHWCALRAAARAAYGLMGEEENANQQSSLNGRPCLLPCPTLRRLASSRNTRHVQSVYDG